MLHLLNKSAFIILLEIADSLRIYIYIYIYIGTGFIDED
jgi:hypothetical protein